MNDKIKNITELAGILEFLRLSGKTIIQCHGVFDLIHPGHIRHFDSAKKEGNILIVTVTPDQFANKGPGRPFFNERLRAESVAALQAVDYVAINQWPTAIEAIGTLKPDLYVKGPDYSDSSSDLTGNIQKEKQAVEAVGGKIHFTDDPTFSSTELLNSYFDVYPSEARIFLEDFKKRYSATEIVTQMQSLKKLKVLVIGESIIDEYHYCKGIGKPLKDSILATQYLNEESFAGGTLACANHVAGFADEVDLVTSLGRNDSKEEFIRNHLKSNVKPFFFYRDGSTIVKRRFVDPAFLSKMFEVCYLPNEEHAGQSTAPMLDFLEKNLRKYDLVLVTDFGHGLLTPPLVKILADKARFLAVNTQTNSANTGFNMITKYPRVDYICIDEPELRLAAHDRTSPYQELIQGIAKELHCKRVTVTRGHRGSITYTGDNLFYETPVFSTKIVDRTGAGDAYLAVTSLCIAANLPLDTIGFIGNAVGAMAVQIVCNRDPVEPIPLFKFIGSLLK